MEEYNTVIIGCGISGMTAAIYLLRANKKILIIESFMPGGQLNYATTIENYPGYKKIEGPALAENIYNQLKTYNPNILFEAIKKTDLNKKIITTTNKTIHYQNLIIATGRTNKKLNLPNEDKLIGNGISFCASCDGYLYKDKKVIVVGGANTAVTEALHLSSICKEVYLIVRKDKLRCEEILKQRLNAKNNIKIIYNANIKSYITNKNNYLTGVLLDNNKKITSQAIFLAIGYIPNSNLFDVNKKNDYIIINKNGLTNKQDTYACGDVIYKDLYQLVTSTSEAAICASSIINKKGV